jgi:hypothetical protein
MKCGDGSTHGKKMDPVDVGRMQIPTKGRPNPAFAYEMGALSLVK